MFDREGHHWLKVA